MNDELLSAEIKRVFERYRAAPASLEDLADRGRSPSWFRRPAALRLGAGGMAVAACLAIVALVLQPFAPTPQSASVFASWQRVPTSPDPAMATWASSHCTNTQLPLLIQDQRGSASLFVFQKGSAFLDCVVWTVDTPTEKGWVSGASSGEFDDSAGPVVLGSEMGIGVAEGSSIQTAVGRAAGATSVVVVTTDGVEVQASVRNGFFAAWWPTTCMPADSVRAVRAYGRDGSLLGELQAPASTAPPCKPFTRQPSPSGPPMSAGT
jgi:hypothetical protein